MFTVIPMGTASGQVLCPVVVGRSDEIDALLRLAASAQTGRGGLACIVGEAGIGKSRLVRETQAAAEARGMIVLRGRAAPSAAPIPYRAFGEAFTGALRKRNVAEDPEFAQLRRTLRVMLPEDSDARSPEPAVSLVHDAVLRLLSALARRGSGLLLVLEDLHWADAETLEVVDYLGDNVADEPILCISTLRDDPGPALDAVEAIAGRRSGHRFTLERLTADQTAEMARHSLGVQHPEPELIEALAARSEGVPFLIEELLTAYVASGGDIAPQALPHTYRELVSARMQAVDPATRQILFAAAVVGRQFDWSLLSAVTGLDRRGVLDGLRVAVREKLVSSDPAPGLEMPFGFRHALVREAILAELLPPERAELSARAADVIEDRYVGLPGEWCERVADLREAAGDRSATARHLQEAAQRAVVRGALASAESMLERARLLITGDRWHLIGVERQLVEVLSLAGKIERLREIAESAIGFVQEKRTAMPFVVFQGLGYLHLRLARGLAAAGDDAGAREQLAHARAVAEETGERHILAGVRAFEASRALHAGDIEVAVQAAREARSAAMELRQSDVLAEALSVEGNAAFLNGDADTALSTLRRARDESGDAPIPRIRALLDLGSVEAIVAGDVSSLESARLLSADAGAVSSEARAEILMAEAALMRFDLASAAGLLERPILTARKYGLALLTEALAIEDELHALAGTDLDAETTHKWDAHSRAHVVAALRLEDREGARRAAVELPADPVARGTEALIAALEGTQIAPPVTAHPLALGLRVAAEAVSLSGGEAGDRYAGADVALERFPWWRHVVRRLVAESAIAQGWGESPAWIRDSLTFFEDIGHERLASACKALLRRAGAPVPRKGRGDSSVPGPMRSRGVTSREMDVLRLVGRGLGNRQIATQLFLSPRTVETHVASLMRKLGVETRAELAAEAAAGTGP